MNLLYPSLIRPGTKAASLEGPLSMFPPAEDNYGTDACAIACLYTRPPTLAIATSEGKLHHCIVLAGAGEGNASQDETQVL